MEKCLEESGQDETEGEGAHKPWHWGVSLSPPVSLVNISITRVGTWECAALYTIRACGIPRGRGSRRPETASGEHRAPAQQGRARPQTLCFYRVLPRSDTPQSLRTHQAFSNFWSTRKRGHRKMNERTVWAIRHIQNCIGHRTWSLPLACGRERVGEGSLRLNKI